MENQDEKNLQEKSFFENAAETLKMGYEKTILFVSKHQDATKFLIGLGASLATAPLTGAASIAIGVGSAIAAEGLMKFVEKEAKRIEEEQRKRADSTSKSDEKEHSKDKEQEGYNNALNHNRKISESKAAIDRHSHHASDVLRTEESNQISRG